MKKLLQKLSIPFLALFLCAGAAQAVSTFQVYQGGTGVGTITGIPYGTGTAPLGIVTIGTGVNFSGGTLSATGTGGTVTTIGSADSSVTITNPTTTPDLAVAKSPKLTTGRTIAITGDLTYTSPSFDGSGNVTGTGTLASIIVAGGPIGSATVVPIITYDAKGRLTAVSSATITPAASSITGAGDLTKTDDTNVTLTLGGTPTGALLKAASITAGWTGTLADSRLSTTAVSAGSYGSATQAGTFTVSATGRLTAAGNTTITPAVGSITGLGTGVATWLATPSSANLASAITDETGSGALVFGTTPTLATPVINGLATGTGVASAATASTLVARDANSNLLANSLISGWRTTATAAGTTTLTIADVYQQYFTGSSTQTVKLPTTSVVAGQQYQIVNQSTGVVTVQSSGANTVTILAGSTSAIFTALVATPTTAANWSSVYIGDIVASGKSLSVSNTLTLAGTDSTTMTFPTTSATIARTDAANTFTGHQTIEGVTSTGATGTGKFVFDTAPTISGGLHTGITTLGIRDTSAAFDVTLAAVSSTNLTAGRTLTLDMGNVAHTLAFGTTTGTLTFPTGTKTLLATDGAGTSLTGIPYTLTGTANQVVLSAGTGNITLSLPQNVDTGAGFQVAKLGVGISSPAGALYVKIHTGTNENFVTRSGTDFAGYSGSAMDSVNDAVTVRNMLVLAGNPIATVGSLGVGTATVPSTLTVNGLINMKNYTVATLPAGTRGDIAYVTDALAPGFLTVIVGGGTVVAPVFFNGTNWVAM